MSASEKPFRRHLSLSQGSSEDLLSAKARVVALSAGPRQANRKFSGLHNNEMQRTKHGPPGASPLISVFCGPDAWRVGAMRADPTSPSRDNQRR